MRLPARPGAGRRKLRAGAGGSAGKALRARVTRYQVGRDRVHAAPDQACRQGGGAPHCPLRHRPPPAGPANGSPAADRPDAGSGSVADPGIRVPARRHARPGDAAPASRRVLQWPHLVLGEPSPGSASRRCLNLAAMRLLPAWQTVPFLAIWVSLTVIYGFRLWRLQPTILTLAAGDPRHRRHHRRAGPQGPAGRRLPRPEVSADRADVPGDGLARPQAAGGDRGTAGGHGGGAAGLAENLRLLKQQRRFLQDASHELGTPITRGARARGADRARGHQPRASPRTPMWSPTS